MTKRTEVLKFIREGGATPPEVSELTGICISTVYRYLAEGVASGELERRKIPHPGGRRGRSSVLYFARQAA